MNRENLRLLTLDDKSIDFVIYNWEKYQSKPNILAKKCKVSIEIIEQAIQMLSQEKFTPLTPEETLSVDEYMKGNPESDDYEEIAVMCDIGHSERVKNYLENKELSEHKKSLILEKFLEGTNAEEIAFILKINITRVEVYLVEYNEYLTRYRPCKDELSLIYNAQSTNITDILLKLQPKKIFIDEYRKLTTNSYEKIILDLQNSSEFETIGDLFAQIIPIAFYYLKCHLPFNEITSIFANREKMPVKLSTQDIFHIIFQQSDPYLRAICIEHYSFSKPIPFYYPVLKDYSNHQQSKPEFEICQELWYTLTHFKALISFGLGRAGWNEIGKSSLLNLIFESDFENGNSKGSLFHGGSIDVQMTKNLLLKGTNNQQADSINWAFFDCHGPTDLEVITFLTESLKVFIVHVLESDFEEKYTEISNDLYNLNLKDKHVFLFIRDCKGNNVNETIHQDYTCVRIPNLTSSEVNIELVREKLKEIGRRILEIKLDEKNILNSRLIEQFLGDLDNPRYGEVMENMKKVEKILDYIRTHGSKDNISFDFLSYYPNFVKLMDLKHIVIYETDSDRIDELNKQINELINKLKHSKPCEIITLFNQLLSDQNASLLLSKLSQELLLYSNSFNSKVELQLGEVQKNNRYTVEILWRELLLSGKYMESDRDSKREYAEMFGRNLSKHVQCGQPFELIDGDNLVFFNNEIDRLLRDFYKDQSELIKEYNNKNEIPITEAPIVLSIIGPKNSGKSLLLNNIFGCKFDTSPVTMSSGRCTRGVFGSLYKLEKPINNSDSILVLDTEGLDANDEGNIKDTSKIHFDRTMVLFCFSVSQAVIINVKGDIGDEMQNLLHICQYSLGRLKVTKTITPKIFFALNQQTDPDPAKHLAALHLLISKLNAATEGGELDEATVNLIQVTVENLFFIPSAFTYQEIDHVSGRLFNFDAMKLCPTMNFAQICSNLRTAIIHQIETMPLADRRLFSSISDWIETAGTIWEVVIKYQDIVKFKSVQEIRCTEKLRDLISDLMAEHILKNAKLFQDKIDELFSRIKNLDNLNTVLLDVEMAEFDLLFAEFRDNCLKEYENEIQTLSLVIKIPTICQDMRIHLTRLILTERRKYEEKLMTQINKLEDEIKLTQSMNTFQQTVVLDIDTFIELTVAEQSSRFEEIWLHCFGQESPEQERREKSKNLENLYSVFLLDCDTMQPRQTILSFFSEKNFDIDIIVKEIRIQLLEKFSNKSATDNFSFSSKLEQCDLQGMTPYNARKKFDYISPSTFYEVIYHTQTPGGSKKIDDLTAWSTAKIKELSPQSGTYADIEIIPKDWVPKDCIPLLQYISGCYSKESINWGTMNWQEQILLLTLSLRSGKDNSISIWEQLLNDLLEDAQLHLSKDPDVSPATIKLIVHELKFRLRLINHELSNICLKLSNFAEKELSSFVFSHAYVNYWNSKLIKKNEDKMKKASHKLELEKYFLQKIQARQMTRGAFDRASMDVSDKNFSNTFAMKFIESVKRESEVYAIEMIKKDILRQKSLFSNETLFLEAHEIIKTEVTMDPEKEILEDNFVIEFICQRNEALKKLFTKKWSNCLNVSFKQITGIVLAKFYESIHKVRIHLEMILGKLRETALKNKHNEDDIRCFDSDFNFEIITKYFFKANYSSDKENLFKAMSIFLKKYLDPNVTREEMEKYFSKFKIDFEIKLSHTYTLPPKDNNIQLDPEIFKKMSNTSMFNENIFNLYVYLENFVEKIKSYKFELNEEELQEIIQTRDSLFSDSIGCIQRCPSCGKFCEREIHTDGSKCQIKTGHQFSSMGGKVWQDDARHTSILHSCDDYYDDMQVHIPGKMIKWSEFKSNTSTEWNWEPCLEEAYEGVKATNLKLMIKIWNKFGRGILEYYRKHTGVDIYYIPYDPFLARIFWKYSVCFVVDGTGSMSTDIVKARVSIESLINTYKSSGKEIEFRVVIYRDHCDSILLEEYPNSSKKDFTKDKDSIVSFMNGVIANGGGDFPEAVVDGLGTATQANWRAEYERKCMIIHIYDAPPHSDFPNYRNHDPNSDANYCCCCSQKCGFDWDRDVWEAMKKQGISYYGISTGPRFAGYENTMKEKLGALCEGFTVCGKEEVNEAIMKIFIQYEKLN